MKRVKRYARRKGHIKQIILLIISAEVLLIVAGLAYIQLRPMVVKAVTMEAGDQALNIDRFLLYGNQKSSFVSDVKKLDTSTPGTYPIKIQVGRRIHTSLLEVVDTTPPTVEVQDQIIPLKAEITPDTFVRSIQDATTTTVSFRKKPDTSKPGKQQVTLVISDSGNNVVTKNATLTILDMKNSVSVPAGEPIQVTPADFINKKGTEGYTVSEQGIFFLTQLSTITTNKPGAYPVELSVHGRRVKAEIKVVDQEAPVIQGIVDKAVFIGDSISYKKGVTITDNVDKDPKFTVDSSKVNLKKAGTYTAVYHAKDSAGNEAVKKITVTVQVFKATREVVNAKCDEILAKIVTEAMTKREKAYAIYSWIRQHISYSGDSDKSDWLAEAYRGMTTCSGDCFTYFAAAQALLTRAEIENKEVTRVGGRTRHYWNLINCGDGWYHFDSCPNKDHKETFMMTDKEVELLTSSRGNHYYTFEKEAFPRTPEK